MMSSMNRLWDINNSYQNFETHKRVLCVCSAGLLRSPTMALVFSNSPYNYNTRAAGVFDYALVAVDEVLLQWADEVVCAELVHQQTLENNFAAVLPKTVCLHIPDTYEYRNLDLMRIIKEKYNALQQ
jgi:predicted protein tyrosine phosphatase